MRIRARHWGIVAAMTGLAPLTIVGFSESCGNPQTGGAGGSSGGSGGIAESSSTFIDNTDSAVFCGNEFHKVAQKAPLLYFVIDVSGSMSTPAVGDQSRYQVLHKAASHLIESLGSLVRVGAALFPYQATDADACTPGEEVMKPTLAVPDGSTAQAFFNATNVDEPFGGTPTASTLQALTSRFKDAAKDPDGPDVVLLVTDGGPDCNDTITCDADQCIPNIDGTCPKEDGNCCTGPTGTPENCLDRGATLDAIQAIAKEGAPVYVIGLSVGDAYDSTMAQMAIVGGAAQASSPYYYRVDDLSNLESTFKGIAAKFISCEVTLSDPPKQQNLTNCYFDGKVVLQDDTDGWQWKSDDTIVFSGKSCDELKDGQVKDVQVVTGCPTQTPS